MNLTKIIIKNFKKIGEKPVEIPITKGMNLIRSEKNGTGKTTILSAIVFLKFGKTSDTKGNSKSTLPTSELINDVNKKELLVEGYFDNGYIIRRGLKPNIFEILDETGSNLADKSSKTIDQDFLESELLGYTHETFMSTIFLNSKPNSIPFIYMSNTQRKEYIEKILDLRIIYFLNENLKKKISDNKQEIIDNQKKLDWSINNLEVMKNEYGRQVTLLEKQKQEIVDFESNRKKQVKSLEQDIVDIQNSITQLEIENNNYNFELNKIELNAGVESIRLKQKEIESEIDSVSTSKLDNSETINNLTHTLQQRNKELEAVKSLIETKQLHKQTLFEELSLLDENLVLSLLSTNKEKTELLRTKIIEKKAEYDSFIKAKDNYHFCGDCEKLTNIIGTFDDTAYDSFKQKSRDIATTLNENSKIYNSTLGKVNELKNNIKTIENDISNLDSNANSLILSINNTEYLLREEQNKIDKFKDNVKLKIQELVNKISILDNQVDVIIDKIKNNISSNILLIQTKKNNIVQIENNINEVKSYKSPELIEPNKQPLIDCEKSIEEIEKNYNILQHKKTEIESVKNYINDKNIKEQALKSYIPMFEHKVNELIDRFTLDDMFTVKAVLTDDFDIEFTKNGKSLNMFSLSEGQKSSITFAFTFAFQHLLDTRHQIKSNSLFIDEILDISLNSTRLHSILEYLKEVSSDKSIYIISHNSSIQEELFDNIINVNIKNGFSSYDFI